MRTVKPCTGVSPLLPVRTCLVAAVLLRAKLSDRDALFYFAAFWLLLLLLYDIHLHIHHLDFNHAMILLVLLNFSAFVRA